MKVSIANSTEDRKACFDIRRRVFIEEQGIPEIEEWDDFDRDARHLLARMQGSPAGTARLIITTGKTAKIGRVAVLASYRGRGLGRSLIQAALEMATEDGLSVAVLDAQLHALAFYAELGFVAEGNEFDDGSGILHRRMQRALT